jgi:Mrp family chromosome partitioning ATPase
VVAVTSPRDGDGKTTCAMNLALAFAESGRRKVLLLEASLRRPALAQAFRVQPPWCFSEQLVQHRQQPLLHWSAVELLGTGVHACVIDPRTKVPPLLDAVAFEIAMGASVLLTGGTLFIFWKKDWL